VIKQADTVMLLALLSDRFPREVHEANYEYYEPRCSHGSSLSRAMHALVAARLGRLRSAEEHFRVAASIDLDDSTGSGSGGVHIATQGGLWQAAVLGFAGLSVREDGLSLDPHLPECWRALRFRVQYRGSEVNVELEQPGECITIAVEGGGPVCFHIAGRALLLEAGQSWTGCWSATGQELAALPGT
jgi:trehalose/maltose hydrolase-like predicted phosphorylase